MVICAPQCRTLDKEVVDEQLAAFVNGDDVRWGREVRNRQKVMGIRVNAARWPFRRECNSVVETLVIGHCYALSLLFSTEFARTIALVLEHLVKFRCGEKHIKKLI